MASTYSSNLRIELIGTGDQSGSWGTTLNRNLGTLLEQAIVGYTTVPITDGPTATDIQISDGLDSDARNYMLELTGVLTADRTLTVPNKKKTYMVFNNTSGGKAVTVKVSGQTGVSVPNGKRRILYCDGTDVKDQITDLPSTITFAGAAPLTESTTTFNGTSASFSGTLEGGTIRAGNGSVGTPSISFSGDTNTGLYWIGADQIGFSSGGVLRATFGTAGLAVSGTFSSSGAATFSAALTGVSATFSSTLTVTGQANLNGGVSATTGVFSGTLAVTSGRISSYGLGGDSSQGVLYLNSTGTRYLHYNGSYYTLAGAQLNVGGNIQGQDIYGKDFYAIRPGSPSTGVIFFGNSGSRFLHWDGSNYNLVGADLWLNGQPVNGTLALKGQTNANNTWTGLNTYNAQIMLSWNTPAILMNETDWGARYGLYMDGGQVGCLNSGGGWASYTDNSGNFFAIGNVAAFSDIKHKKDIVEISPEEATELVRKTEGVRYTDRRDGQRKIGVVAQQIQPHLPELVTQGVEDSLTVYYQNMVAVLNQSLKHAHDRIDQLEKLLNGDHK